jgi:hypothetical protein
MNCQMNDDIFTIGPSIFAVRRSYSPVGTCGDKTKYHDTSCASLAHIHYPVVSWVSNGSLPKEVYAIDYATSATLLVMVSPKRTLTSLF